MGSFGVSLPVVALNNGFLGEVTRIGKRGITARQVLASSANGPKFGDPLVIVPNNGAAGDTYMNVADFITANGAGAFNPSLFAGVAVRNVKTNIAYSSLTNIPATLVGQYVPGEIAEGLEEGSIIVKLNNGTAASQSPLYIRTVANGGIPAGVVGGFEGGAPAVSDVISTTATTAAGSANITVTSAADLVVGQQVAMNGILANSAVTAIVGTTVTLNTKALITQGTAAPVTFTNLALIAGVLFRTGNVDANGAAEITILNRVAA